MNVRDLMIGDLIKFKYLPRHDDDVFNGRVCADMIKQSGDFEIIPIPLTPEILEKNGWYHGRFDGSYGRKAMRLDGPYKDKLPDGVDNALSFAQWSIDEKFEYHLLDVYLWKGSVHVWIEYVHELQHVFKLCGIEKEIVL